MRGQTVAGFDQRDVVHEQADHALPFPIRCVRIMPEPREVRREREDPRTSVGIDGHAIRLPLSFIDRLCLGDLLQGAVPVGLQFVGDESIRGIDL